MFALLTSATAAYTATAAGAPRACLLRPATTRAAVNLQIQMPGEESVPGPDAMVGPPQAEMAIVADETYGLMLKTLIETNASIPAQVSANYAMVDYGFLQRLDEGLRDEKDEAMQTRLKEIKEACNSEMAKRMQAAAEALRDVLTSPSPVVMDGKIAGLARQGRLDDALLQLLEANLQQAQAAGEQGKGAVAVLGKLQARVQTELDTRLSPPTALLRRLLRMDDKHARMGLLKEKMSPKKKQSIILTDSTGQEEKEEDTDPDVDPRALAQAITEIKARFGNVDENYDTGFVERLLTIADEAEATALELADGKELSARQQQDLAWDKGAVSVWDLAQVEEEAHQEGKMAMWEEEAQAQFARQDEAMRKKAIDMDYEK